MKRGRIALAAAVASAVIVGWTTLDSGDHQVISAGAEFSASGVGEDVAELLGKVVVVDELPHVSGYERGCGIDKKTKFREGCVFGRAWNDPDDRSGCDTRNRILAAQLHDVKFKPGSRDCKVVAGWLIDPYTGTRITLGQIQIDHVFSEHRAWNAGAAGWDAQRRIAFANDPANLLAVSSKANEAKGDSGIGQWLPPRPDERCSYVMRYLKVAVSYQLSVTVGDRAAAVTACRA